MQKDESDGNGIDHDGELSYLPIQIGGGLSIFIVIAGIVLGYIILKHPNSKITKRLATFVE